MQLGSAGTMLASGTAPAPVQDKQETLQTVANHIESLIRESNGLAWNISDKLFGMDNTSNEKAQPAPPTPNTIGHVLMDCRESLVALRAKLDRISAALQ